MNEPVTSWTILSQLCIFALRNPYHVRVKCELLNLDVKLLLWQPWKYTPCCEGLRGL